MGYIYDCDGCNKTEHSFPPFAGEFTEQFLKTVGGQFAAVFDPGEKVTICADCMELQVLAGKIVVCQRCGWSVRATELPAGKDECPGCEESESFVTREVETGDGGSDD